MDRFRYARPAADTDDIDVDVGLLAAAVSGRSIRE